MESIEMAQLLRVLRVLIAITEDPSLDLSTPVVQFTTVGDSIPRESNGFFCFCGLYTHMHISPASKNTSYVSIEAFVFGIEAHFLTEKVGLVLEKLFSYTKNPSV